MKRPAPALTSEAGKTYNKGRKVTPFMVGLPHTAALSRHVMAVTWRRFLFSVFCDQHNHKGQNRKHDHKNLIISHTLTPFFGKSGAKALPVAQSSSLALPCQILVSLPAFNSLTASPLCPLGTRSFPAPCRNLPAYFDCNTLLALRQVCITVSTRSPAAPPCRHPAGRGSCV